MQTEITVLRKGVEVINPEKLKKGDIRGDGLTYYATQKGKNIWLDAESFVRWVESHRKAKAKHRAANIDRIRAEEAEYAAKKRAEVNLDPEKREKTLTYLREYHKDNRDILILKKREAYYENKEVLLAKKKKVYHNDPEKFREIAVLSRRNRKEKDPEFDVKNRQYQRDYYHNNKETSSIRGKWRLRNDPLFAASSVARTRITDACRRNGFKKTSPTQLLLGCNWDEFKLHLESKFQPGMTWENRGNKGWHIDHIIPLVSATTEAELYKLFHYTNTQPLWAFDNYVKSSKMPCGKRARRTKLPISLVKTEILQKDSAA